MGYDNYGVERFGDGGGFRICCDGGGRDSQDGGDFVCERGRGGGGDREMS